MSERRVAITGLGAISAGGIGAEAMFDTLCAGGRHVAPITLLDASSFPCRIGGQLIDFSARDYVPKNYRKAVKVMARDIEIAVAAAGLAVRDAGIVADGLEGVDPAKATIASSRLGCNIGAGLICVDLEELSAAVNTAVVNGEFDYKKWGREGMPNLTPLWLLKYLPNMLACHVTIIHQAKGPSNTITCGEASSHLAVGEAYRTIARGAVDAVIAGGAESKLNPMGLLRQTKLGRLVADWDDDPGGACRPFDAAHRGTVIGEGGGLLILEELDRAVTRGVRRYAEVVGFGAGCDPEGIDFLHSHCAGLPVAIRTAVADAKITPDQLDLVLPSGSGVASEDVAEAAALAEAMGAAAAKVSVAAITGTIGHCYAGAGGLNMAVGAMALHRQVVPATANFRSPAEGCPLNVTTETRPAELNYVLCCGSSIGGQAGAVVLKRIES